jgi:acyl-CoA reductase-like NAD-dependent aldehyde dehydrogenase
VKVTNPATGAVIREVPEDDPAEVARKHERARRAQPDWAARPYEERAAAIRRLRDLLVERREPLARTLTSEMGKPIAQSRNELEATPGRIDFFLETTPAVLRDETVLQRDGLEETITLEPLGTVANVSAWNYPYFVGSNVFIPALLTGNAVLYKPSGCPKTSSSWSRVGERRARHSSARACRPSSSPAPTRPAAASRRRRGAGLSG